MINIPDIKYYACGDRLYVQSQQIWLILVTFVMSPLRKSSSDKTITYGKLALLMGYPDKRAGHMLGRQLGIIGECCKRNNLPTLNSIVVNQDTGLPGGDVVLRDGYTIEEEQNAVMDENWLQIRIPSTGMFRKEWESMH